MKPFEKMLRLTLDLYELEKNGKSDGPEGDAIRDQMDGPCGWGGPASKDGLLTDREKELLSKVSSALRRIVDGDTCPCKEGTVRQCKMFSCGCLHCDKCERSFG